MVSRIETKVGIRVYTYNDLVVIPSYQWVSGAAGGRPYILIKSLRR